MILFVEILPKPGIFDPQGSAVKDALHQLDFKQVTDTQIGKLVRLDLECENSEEGVQLASQMAEKLLVNPNVETYRVFTSEGDLS